MNARDNFNQSEARTGKGIKAERGFWRPLFSAFSLTGKESFYLADILKISSCKSL